MKYFYKVKHVVSDFLLDNWVYLLAIALWLVYEIELCYLIYLIKIGG